VRARLSLSGLAGDFVVAERSAAEGVMADAATESAAGRREPEESPAGDRRVIEGANVRLSAYDRVILELDRPDNLLVVVLAILLPPEIDAGAVATTLAERAGRAPLLRRCIQRASAPRWSPDPEFDAARHVRRLGGRRDLADEVAQAFMRPFAADRPAWEILVMDADGESTPLLLRIHHVYGDGAAIEDLLAPLVDADVDRSAQSPAARAAPSGGALTVEILRDPLRVARVAVEIVRTLLRRADRVTALRAKLSGSKRVAWSAPLDLASLKKRAHALGCSTTDLLACGYARALRELLERREAVCSGDCVRASVTATVRQRGEARPAGNRFGMMAVDLPLGAAGPGARLDDVKRQFERDKKASQGLAAYLLAVALGRLPAKLRRFALSLSLSRFSVNLTHISGPTRAIRVGGHQVRELIAFAPPAGESGLCLTAFSYNGKLSMTVVADTAITASPATLLAAIDREFADLALVSLPAPPPPVQRAVASDV
jgi:WS/DGAT/MGAT family acyltransferase